MSTILDALKKSERERKLNKVPTLGDMPTPEEPSKMPLLLGVCAILLLALILLWLLFDRTGIDGPARSSQTTVISNESVVATQTKDESIVVNVVSYAEQADQRFVMIDGKMFREGEFVRAGLKVVEIQEDSVVLNERGKRFVREP